jgi:hypothetical protein
VALTRAFFFVVVLINKTTELLSAFTSDTTGKLDILGHDRNPFSMDSAQVGIFKETDEVSFTSFLKSHDSRRLEAEISLEILSDFTNQALKGKLADEKLSRFLVTTDFTKSHSTGTITMGLLNTTSCWSTLTSCLSSKLFTRGLATGRFASGLLCTRHDIRQMKFE